MVSPSLHVFFFQLEIYLVKYFEVFIPSPSPFLPPSHPPPPPNRAATVFYETSSSSLSSMALCLACFTNVSVVTSSFLTEVCSFFTMREQLQLRLLAIGKYSRGRGRFVWCRRCYLRVEKPFLLGKMCG